MATRMAALTLVVAAVSPLDIIHGKSSPAANHTNLDQSGLLSGGVLADDAARLKEMLHWSVADESALIELPPLGNYWSLNKTARLNNGDGLAYMRVQKTGSKSTVQLMKTGWLWGQRKHAQVPGGIEKKENEYGAPMLCNVASCTRGPMTMPVKARECQLEGHCHLGSENHLRLALSLKKSRIAIIATIRDPVLRLLSEMRHYCGQPFEACDGVSKKRPRARQRHQTPSGEASVKGFQETVRFALGEAVSSIPQRNLIPDAISGSIDSSKSSKRGGSNATLSETLQKGGRKPSHYSGYVCPTEVPYCEDEKTVDWASFVAFAQRKSNSFARSRMTQMIGITVPGELDGIKLPLTDGANVNKAEKMVRFSYESDRRWLEPAYNAAGDPAMEARVLLPFLKKAKNALEETIDAVIITDDAGTYGVSLAVVAKRFSVPPPRAYDLIYETKERSIKFPALPPSVRAQVEPFVASDLSLWRHARALLYQRAYSGLLSPEICVPSRMLDNTVNAQSCGSAVLSCMKSECYTSKDVPVQGANNHAQRSDHICALPEACTWATGIEMVANRMDVKRGVIGTKKMAPV